MADDLTTIKVYKDDAARIKEQYPKVIRDADRLSVALCDHPATDLIPLVTSAQLSNVPALTGESVAFCMRCQRKVIVKG